MRKDKERGLRSQLFHQVLLSIINKSNTAFATFPNCATSLLILPYGEDKTMGVFSSGPS